jgi:hypothetical protein
MTRRCAAQGVPFAGGLRAAVCGEQEAIADVFSPARPQDDRHADHPRHRLLPLYPRSFMVSTPTTVMRSFARRVLCE